MSIIYDALKKIEKFNSPDSKLELSKEDKRPKPRTRIYLIYALVVCAGLFLGNIIFKFLPQPSLNPPRVLPKPAAAPVPAKFSTKTSLFPPVSANKPLSIFRDLRKESRKEAKEAWVLNGVFFSENEGCALINNQIVKEGDVVGGATVKRIELGEVELEISGSVFKLSNRSSR